MPKILIVDDDPFFCDVMSEMVKRLGYESATSQNLDHGIKEAARSEIDLIFLDVNFSKGNGLERISDFQTVPSRPEIIILTGSADQAGAEKALTSGAWDYLQKPPSYNEMKLLIKRALEFRENKLERSRNEEDDQFELIVGKGAKIRDCLDTAYRAAQSSGSVLITGETGTGKELFARAVHSNSPRRNKNFVVVDCTCIPNTLAESLLFGHKKGSFTDAKDDKPGFIKQADGGTLFLDEIGDLSLEVQKSLLRVIQEGRFIMIGSQKEETSNFRLISATNRDLEDMVEKNLFRKDLYFRLRAIHLHLPPLRERVEDISLLLERFLPKISKEYGYKEKNYSKDFLETLTSYSWPGNVREFLNVLHSSIANAADSDVLNYHHLPVEFRILRAKSKIKPGETVKDNAPDQEAAAPQSPGLGDFMSLFSEFPNYKEMRNVAVSTAEGQYFQKLVEISDGDLDKACSMSKLSRARLYELLKKHGIKLK